MAETNKPARPRVGKMDLADLAILAVELGAATGACLAMHVWMVG